MCYGEAYQRSELKCKGTAERRNAKELLRKVLKRYAQLRHSWAAKRWEKRGKGAERKSYGVEM